MSVFNPTDVATPRIDTAEVANDYTVSASETFSASAMGIPTVSGTVQIVFVDDQAWENLESVEFHFTDMTAVDSITFTSTVEVRIQDDGMYTSNDSHNLPQLIPHKPHDISSLKGSMKATIQIE